MGAAAFIQHAESIVMAGAERNGELGFDLHYASVAAVIGEGAPGSGQQSRCNQ
jgi:hypothetical protein